MQPTIEVDLQSLNDNANLLVELAGALGAGRPDAELSLRACAPATPPEVSDEVRTFANFAADQYQDLVALLAALSTRLDLRPQTLGTTQLGHTPSNPENPRPPGETQLKIAIARKLPLTGLCPSPTRRVAAGSVGARLRPVG